MSPNRARAELATRYAEGVRNRKSESARVVTCGGKCWRGKLRVEELRSNFCGMNHERAQSIRPTVGYRRLWLWRRRRGARHAGGKQRGDGMPSSGHREVVCFVAYLRIRPPWLCEFRVALGIQDPLKLWRPEKRALRWRHCSRTCKIAARALDE